MTEKKVNKIDIVIPYIIAGDNCNELRYALRSIAENLSFKGEVVIWLVGDKPDFVKNINHIPVDRIKGMDYMSYLDTCNKIHEACLNNKIGSGFIYTYDDIYFINKTTVKDIQQLKAMEDMTTIKEWFKTSKASKKWKNLLRKTLNYLRENKLPIWNYETHCPRYYNKKKALRLIEKHNMLVDPWQFASLYYNTYYPDSKPVLLMPWGAGIKLGVYREFPCEELREKVGENKFLNYDTASYNDEMKKLISDLFPNKCKYEK